jgi:ABC-type lipoprotein export system ATPase subunit
MAALLSLIGVTKRYSRGVREIAVLDDVSLDLRSGDFACVLGGRGDGKTTLLEIASGYRPPDSGRVLFQDRDLSAASDRARSRLLRSEIACVWNRSVPVVLAESVLDHVGLPLRSARVSRKRARSAAAAMIERVGARDYADAAVTELSEGQRMRVALAQACVRSPRLLIADELTDTLDLVERSSVLALLQGFAREGVGILMTATDAHGAMGCTRLLSLSGGCLIEPEMPESMAPVPAKPGDVVPFRARGQGGGSSGA